MNQKNEDLARYHHAARTTTVLGRELRPGDRLVVRWQFTGTRVLYVQRIAGGGLGKLRVYVEAADDVALYWPYLEVGRYEERLIEAR